MLEPSLGAAAVDITEVEQAGIAPRQNPVSPSFPGSAYRIDDDSESAKATIPFARTTTALGWANSA